MLKSTTNNRIIFSCLAFLFTSTNTLSAVDKTKTPQHQQEQHARSDSLHRKPHEVEPEPWIKQLSFSEQSLSFPIRLSKTNSLFPNVNISADTFPQNEPTVKISRKNSNRAVAAWRDFRKGVSPAVRRIGYSYSADGGTTWSTSALVDSFSTEYPRSSDPALGVDTAGNFYLATISINSGDADGKIIVFKSTDQGQTFNTASFAPADTGTDFDDKEYITSDLVPGSPYSNNLYISWTRFFTFGGEGMMLTRSTDGGSTWSPSTQVSDGGNAGQGSVPAIGPNGEVYVAWQNSSVYFDKSTDGGLTFGTDKLTGLNCTDVSPSIAVDLSGGARNGYIYIASTDARFGDDDILLTYSSDGGTTWSLPKRVNDDPTGNGKLQYWPWIAVDDAGNINIVFFDTRNTPNSNITETFLARSADGGLTFTNELLSTQQSAHNTPNGAVRFGDYIGIDAWKGRIVPVWTDERTGNFNMDIYTATFSLFDYSPFSFLSPTNGSQIGPGTTVSPISAKFQNIGSQAQTDSFDVKYRILLGNSELYANTKHISELGSLENRTVTFDGSFTPSDTGIYTLQAIVMAGDQVATNDTLNGTVHAVYPFNIAVNENVRWNLISTPIQRTNMSVLSLFPTAIPGTTNLYNAAYFPVDSLVPGLGYWAKFPSAILQNIYGYRIDSITINVTKGWNLIGAVDHVTPAPSGGIVQNSVYGFSNGYQIVSTLQPGKGYWVKATSAGSLKLGPAAVPKGQEENFASYAHLSFTDRLGQEQILYVEDNFDGKLDLTHYEMPPLAPVDAFDIRFASQRILEAISSRTSREFPIQLTSVVFPLNTSWKPASTFLNARLIVDGKEIELSTHRNITIESAPSQMVLRISDMPRVPTEFVLYQNYPNPFNPSTELRFDVPQVSDVLLKIYNILGQNVVTLVNEKKPAGAYTIEWDARTMPSGMYFYKLTAGSFSQTKKMVLLK